MKICIYPIKSVLAYGDTISKESAKLLNELHDKTGYEFELVGLNDLSKGDLPLILVQSGGSEGFFKKDIYPTFKGPYYLLTYGSSNSLAASLEILSFIKEENKKGEVLHGDNDYIANRLKALIAEKKTKANKPARLGVVGVPSDWLISSNVDYQKAKDIFAIDLVDVPEEKILELVKKHHEKVPSGEFKAEFNPSELDKAYGIYEALKELCAEEKFEGFTLRCFDIIKAVHMSACLGLSLMNRDGIIASCEGDVPAMITAYSILKCLGVHAFQANPNWIDPAKNQLTLAHCTLPLDMAESYQFDTHFESGIGVGIHGVMKKGDVTIVKVSSSLNEFYCEEGEILENQYRKDRCRTQIVIQMGAPVTYFLKSSLGNHHQVIYGHHKAELKAYFESLGLREIEG
jgi:L-fucose isomerase-like protein